MQKNVDYNFLSNIKGFITKTDIFNLMQITFGECPIILFNLQ